MDDLRNILIVYGSGGLLIIMLYASLFVGLVVKMFFEVFFHD